MTTPDKNTINRFILQGKIDGVSEFKGNWSTRIVMPAHDEYSKPEIALLKTNHKVGSVGEMYTGAVKPCGFKHFYTNNDNVTVNTAKCHFELANGS